MPRYETPEERDDRRRREAGIRAARRRGERRETREPDCRAVGSALIRMVVPRLVPAMAEAVVQVLVEDGYDRDAAAAALAALAMRTPKTPIASKTPTRPRASERSL